CGTGGVLVGTPTIDPSTGAGSFDCRFPDGPASPTVSVTVSDGDGGSDSDQVAVTVANVSPEITLAAFNATSVSCSENTVTLTVDFTDPGADTWLATIDWGDGSQVQTVDPATSPIEVTHTYALAGVYQASVSVADDDGGVSDSDPNSMGAQPTTASITVNYTIVGGGFLPPINNTGHGQNPSVFKYGSTIPVKIKVQDCDGSYPSTLAPRVYVQKMNGSTPVDGELEPSSTSAADSGNTMRFTGPPDFQYIFNLATKSFSTDSTSTWQLIVRIPATGQEIRTTIGLKK
ncbi:MAG TPA: PKD domain-containing protein, partial [Actinomycetota bacterium]|nr:PKD domain-containing protein [Actinomycetota bacterium]